MLNSRPAARETPSAPTDAIRRRRHATRRRRRSHNGRTAGGQPSCAVTPAGIDRAQRPTSTQKDAFFLAKVGRHGNGAKDRSHPHYAGQNFVKPRHFLSAQRHETKSKFYAAFLGLSPFGSLSSTPARKMALRLIPDR